jgi:hypothetical protein
MSRRLRKYVGLTVILFFCDRFSRNLPVDVAGDASWRGCRNFTGHGPQIRAPGTQCGQGVATELTGTREYPSALMNLLIRICSHSTTKFLPTSSFIIGCCIVKKLFFAEPLKKFNDWIASVDSYFFNSFQEHIFNTSCFYHCYTYILLWSIFFIAIKKAFI